MPYIKQDDRDYLNTGYAPSNAGQLNYVITQACNEYLYHAGITYSSINEVIGVLECAKLELYRRIAASYEDKKINENGDVYTV